MVFDVLSQLESYQNTFSEIQNVIDIMDRSLPYDQKEGTYVCPENSNVSYSVSTILTSDKGILLKVDKKAIVITLEGEMVVSSKDVDKVFILSEGRFILVDEGEWRICMSSNLPTNIKYCVFTF